MKVLLDENFPLRLLHVLRSSGIEADHIITLGWRGLPDSAIRDRVKGQDVLFLTQDGEFLSAAIEPFKIVVVSRVRQSRPIAERVTIWDRAVRELTGIPQVQMLFELMDDGRLLPWIDASR